MAQFAGCSRCVLQLLFRSHHRIHIRLDATDVVVLISDIFDKDGHRVVSAIYEYLAVKFRYLGDEGRRTRWLVQLPYFVFEALSLVYSHGTVKASKSAYSTKGTGSVFAIALHFFIFFSGSYADGYTIVCSGWTEQSWR